MSYHVKIYRSCTAPFEVTTTVTVQILHFFVVVDIAGSCGHMRPIYLSLMAIVQCVHVRSGEFTCKYSQIVWLNVPRFEHIKN